MKLNELLPYAKNNKAIKNSFTACCVSVVLLIIQLVLMNRTAVNIIFLFLIPGISVGAYAFHGITMTEDRPTMLILMPMSYLLSLLINELIAVEVGAQDTYPYIPLFELIPLLIFSFAMATKRGKKATKNILKIWIALLFIACAALAFLTLFLNIKITHAYNNIKQTFAMVCGIAAVICLYFSMLFLTGPSGNKVKGIPFLTRRSSQLSN